MVDFPEEFSTQVKVPLRLCRAFLGIQQQNRKIIFSQVETIPAVVGYASGKYHESEDRTVENRKLGRGQILGLIGKLCGEKGEAGEGPRSLGLTLGFGKEGLGLGNISVCGEKIIFACRTDKNPNK